MNLKLDLKKIGLILSCTGLLSACADLNSKFTCPIQPGVMCANLDDVNAMVDQGKIGAPNSTTDASIDNATASLLSQNNAINLATGDPWREGESILRIWVAPYEDGASNYHQASLLYSLVREGHWVNNPLQAIS